jgi:geranylgeranylglycerol-phosphate geranylgeranyltransferase
LFAGAVAGFLVGPVTGAFAALNAVLMYYYSKWIKKTGLPGNLTVAFSTASTILYGALAELEWGGELVKLWTVLPVYAMVFLMTLSREIVKGVRTLAVVKGPRNALEVALVLLLTSVACAYLAAWSVGLGPVFLTLVTLGGALSAVSIARCLRSTDPVRCAAKPRRAMKVAMFLGLLGIIADRAALHVLYIQPRER